MLLTVLCMRLPWSVVWANTCKNVRFLVEKVFKDSKIVHYPETGPWSPKFNCKSWSRLVFRLLNIQNRNTGSHPTSWHIWGPLCALKVITKILISNKWRDARIGVICISQFSARKQLFTISGGRGITIIQMGHDKDTNSSLLVFLGEECLNFWIFLSERAAILYHTEFV